MSDTKCPQCDRPVTKHEYCSRYCFLASRRVIKTCITCAKQFSVLKCYDHRKFCSRKCIKKLTPLKLVSVRCAWCAADLLKHPSIIKGNAHVFCDRECYDEFHSRLSYDVNCGSCGKLFSVTNSVRRQYCSRECYKKNYVPQNHYTNNQTGWYASNKGGSIRYDSSLELRRLKALDFDAGVMTFKRCEDKIPWVDASGEEHYYHPDFDITLADGTRVVEETKGFVNEDTKRKIAAARSFYVDVLYRVLYPRDVEVDLEYFVSYYDNSMGTKCRPRIETTFMRTTLEFSKYSTCNRLAVGAMFVDPRSEQVLCFGYNGTWAGGPNDCDTLEPGKCGCIHAEVNAMTKATQTLEGSTLFVTTAPCFSCSKLLINRRIAKVVYLKAYRDVSGITLLRKNGIEVTKYADLVDFSTEDVEMVSSCVCEDDDYS